jgi:quinolinate synthase
MSDNISVHYPELEFSRPCNLCPHMKRITLSNIRRALETMQHEVEIDPETAVRARLSVERMLAVS